jgi:hypothetical protein
MMPKRVKSKKQVIIRVFKIIEILSFQIVLVVARTINHYFVKIPPKPLLLLYYIVLAINRTILAISRIRDLTDFNPIVIQKI